MIASLLGAMVLAIGYPLINDNIFVLGVVLLLDIISISVVPGLIDGYRSEHIPDEIQGAVQGSILSIASASIIVSTFVYGILSRSSIETPFYWFGLNFVILATILFPLMKDDTKIAERPIAH